MATRIYRDYKHLARDFYSGRQFVAFDTETTGLHCTQDHLIEIGAVKFDCHGPVGSPFNALIKPPVIIPDFITQLTHIDNQMVQDQKDVFTVLDDFIEYVGGKDTILVAHNAPFDLGFINASLYLKKKELSNPTVDTLPLSRWAYPELSMEKEKGQYKLQSLAKRKQIQVMAAHRAHDDARVCMEILKAIIQDTLPKQKDYEELKKKAESDFSESNENLQLELF